MKIELTGESQPSVEAGRTAAANERQEAKAIAVSLLKFIGKKGLYVNDDGTIWEDAFAGGTDVTEKTLTEYLSQFSSPENTSAWVSAKRSSPDTIIKALTGEPPYDAATITTAGNLPDAGEKQRQEHSDTWDAAIKVHNEYLIIDLDNHFSDCDFSGLDNAKEDYLNHLFPTSNKKS